MGDGLTMVRCPRCGSPTVEYIAHDPPVSRFGAIVRRFECIACEWSSDGHAVASTGDGP
jgi:C4-type Zn-finger protein